MADEIGLLVAHKPDSQDICFVPDGDYASFIENTTDQVLPTGNFVTPEGKVLGKHKGIIHYTVGQRKGLDWLWDTRHSSLKSVLKPTKL